MLDKTVYCYNRHGARSGHTESGWNPSLPADLIPLSRPSSDPTTVLQRHVQDTVSKHITQTKSDLELTKSSVQTPAHEPAMDLLTVTEFNNGKHHFELAEYIL